MKTLMKRLTLVAMAIFCVVSMLMTTFASVAGYELIDPCSSANGTYCSNCKTECMYTDTTDYYTGYETIIGTANVCKEVEVLTQRTYCKNCGIITHEVYHYIKLNHPNRYYDEETGEYFCTACGFRELPPT